MEGPLCPSLAALLESYSPTQAGVGLGCVGPVVLPSQGRDGRAVHLGLRTFHIPLGGRFQATATSPAHKAPFPSRWGDRQVAGCFWPEHAAGAVGRSCLLCGLSACGVEAELPRVSPQLPFPVSPHAPRDGCTLTWPWRSQGGPRTLLSGNSRALLLCLVQEADGNLTGKCLGLSTGPHHLSCCKRGASTYSRVQRLHPIPLPWPQAQVLSLPCPQASCSPDPLGPSP